jgi:hypothetical protein
MERINNLLDKYNITIINELCNGLEPDGNSWIDLRGQAWRDITRLSYFNAVDGESIRGDILNGIESLKRKIRNREIVRLGSYKESVTIDFSKVC